MHAYIFYTHIYIHSIHTNIHTYRDTYRLTNRNHMQTYIHAYMQSYIHTLQGTTRQHRIMQYNTDQTIQYRTGHAYKQKDMHTDRHTDI